MAEQKPDWTYNEFLAYLLLYAAHADFEFSKEEKKELFSQVEKKEYKSVQKEFNDKKDYERLQLIQSFKAEFFNNEKSVDKLLDDLKQMFLADGRYNSIERAIFMGLRRILLQ